MMKKLLSLLLSVIMLLSCCACAEGIELRIGDIQIHTTDGSTLDFSEIDLRLAAALGEGGAGVRIAVDSGDATALSGIAAVGGQGIVLAADGLSSAYVITVEDILMLVTSVLGEIVGELDPSDFTQIALPSEEDLLALLAAVMIELEAVASSMADAGIEEYDGASYQNYTLSVTEENMNNCILALCGLMDKYPQFTAPVLEQVGFESVTELWQALGLSLAAEGELSLGDEDFIADFDLIVNDANVLNIFLYVLSKEDAETGVYSLDAYLTFYGVDENGDEMELIDLNGCLSINTASGAFDSFDGYITVPVDEETDEGIFFGVYGPEETGTGLTELVLSDWNDAFSASVSFGVSDGLSGVYSVFQTEDAEVGFFVEGADGEGSFGASLADSQFGAELLGGFSVSPVDDAWLNVDTTDAVNILTITEEELAELSGEATMLLLGAVSQIAASNETVMSLFSSMMG